MQTNTNYQEHIQKREAIGQVQVPITLLALAALFLIFMLPRTDVVSKSPALLNILNIAEMPLYLCVFLLGIYRNIEKTGKLVPIALVFIIFLITYLCSGYAEPLKATMLVVGMQDIDYKKLISTLYYVLIFSIIMTVGLYVCGISDAGVQRRGATSLGYIQANAVGFVLMFLTFLSLLRKDKVTITHRIILFFINVVGYILSDSKTGFLLSCVALIFMNGIVYGIIRDCKLVRLILSLMPCICCAFTLVTAYTYQTSRISQIFDKLLTGRVWLNHYNLTHHSIPLFGQSITLWNDTDSFYNPVTDTWSHLMTVDSFYLMSLLSLGVLTTVTFFYLYRRLILRLSKKGEYASLVVLSLICLYGLTESSVLSIYVFFPFLTFLNENKSAGESADSKNKVLYRRIQYDT